MNTGALELYEHADLLAELRRLRTRYTAGNATVVNARVADSTETSPRRSRSPASTRPASDLIARRRELRDLVPLASSVGSFDTRGYANPP